MDDTVRDIIDRFMRMAPNILVECAYRIEQDVRADWCGKPAPPSGSTGPGCIGS